MPPSAAAWMPWRGSRASPLVGGDTTSGPLAISIQVHGFVPQGQAVRRQGAGPGDLVCVSGTLGDAGLALRAILAGLDATGWPARPARTPDPAGGRGAGPARSGQRHDRLLRRPGGGPRPHPGGQRGGGRPQPCRPAPVPGRGERRSRRRGDWALPLASGDDYELCFTLPAQARGALPDLARAAGCPLAVIGRHPRGQGAALLAPGRGRVSPGADRL